MREYGTGRVEFLGTSYKIDRATGKLIKPVPVDIQDDYCKLFHRQCENISCKGVLWR